MRFFPPFQRAPWPLLALGGALLSPAAAGAALPPDSGQSAYAVWYRGLRESRADPGRGASVRDLVITRDAATFELTSGALHLLEPIDGHTVGAVFVGEGRFSMTPPVAVERDQLRRLLGRESVDVPISSAVLYFTDETLDELSGSVAWEPRDPPRDAEGEVEDALDYLSDDDGWAHRDIMRPLVNGQPGFFHAHVAGFDDDPLLFTIAPHRFEEVSLSRRARSGGDVAEVVSRFHRAEDYARGRSLPQEALDVVRILRYDIESVITSKLDFSAEATVDLVRLESDRSWVPFHLYSELEVDSARWGDGSEARFHRPEDSSDLWIDFSTAPADSTALTVHYGGDLLDSFRDWWIEVKSSTDWFPVYEHGRPVRYRLTFHAPEDFRVVTVGRLVSEVRDEDAETVTTVWETPAVRQITFNVGEFEEHRVEDPRTPELTIQLDEDAHRKLQTMASEANVYVLEQRDMADQVARDLANSFAFYGEVFGPPPVSEFVATEIPYAHGEAYPGLVLLSWTTFQWTSAEGTDEMFRSHEVAHQWWGVGVRPTTYHDRWLSEGFAEFSSLWYTARARGSVGLFMERLKETREAILERRDEAAPLWLGTRAGTSDHPSDYQTIVYEKGAWVLHMLRTLMTDPETGSDEAFTAMMKDFYSRHEGGSASTEQFMKVVEEHAGMPMGWFFRQWVYGSAIPTYRFSHKVDALEGGEYRATVRVRQENVPENFQMIVPVLLDFGDEGTAVVRIVVDRPVTEAVLPTLPMEPERIELNPYEAVLAETRSESWEG